MLHGVNRGCFFHLPTGWIVFATKQSGTKEALYTNISATIAHTHTHETFVQLNMNFHNAFPTPYPHSYHHK